MAWRVYRVELIAAWMLSAPEDKRRLMHYWFAAMVKGPEQVAHGGLVRTTDGKRMYYAVPPDTGAVVAYIANSEDGSITIVGVEDCVDGLVVRSAHRLAMESE